MSRTVSVHTGAQDLQKYLGEGDTIRDLEQSGILMLVGLYLHPVFMGVE